MSTAEQLEIGDIPSFMDKREPQGQVQIVDPAPAPALPVTPQNDAASLMQVITRLASDPATDMPKIERLMELYERMEARAAEAEATAAFAEMQPEFPVIGERGGIKNKAGQIQSRYALWEDINEAIKPILAAHGFTLSFRIEQPAEAIKVTGLLKHRGGHTETTEIVLPADHSGSKNAVQAVASSVSYGKRYTAGALLNLTSRGEDDDGAAAGAGPRITEAQLDELIALADEVGADKAKFCRFMRVEAMPDIAATDFGRAKTALERKR